MSSKKQQSHVNGKKDNESDEDDANSVQSLVDSSDEKEDDYDSKQ